ncbi:MAG: hypothetical protein RL115_339 [Bacteroidota bacterium]|jgi:hypothetical protein
MEITYLSLIVAIISLFISLATFFKKATVQATVTSGDKLNTSSLRLQAYERLVLLTERIALPNLISRLNQPGISAVEMKLILTENIKQEMEYNSTQQLYVSQGAWDALKNMKEQNIMLINQVSGSLPATASSADLNKKLLEILLNQPGSAMHETVLNALNAEAKLIMG